ncbi:hypothetical protein FBEOM_8150 [Fusarium beomiforme]|uniref:Uncharacterized protein n=1 Tax=Fusarium beomiforme TaxID=44412 RepID=A0A9P5AGM8_9HYPO|nr:hypothetical protein FBEOM_8150 [Fusarium beomiforme]
MAVHPFFNKDKRTSHHRSFHVPPFSPPGSEFTQSNALPSSHTQTIEGQNPPMSHVRQHQPLHDIVNSRDHHLTDIPHAIKRVREVDASPPNQIPRSPGQYQLSDLDLCSHKAQPSPVRAEPEYDLYQMAPPKRYRVSFEPAIDYWPSYWQPLNPASDRGLAHTGSWCRSAPVELSNAEIEWHGTDRDVLSEEWYPRTPMETRLSTPDLPPLSTDFEFCPCHRSGEHDQDRINQEFYFTTRSKMDLQMINALAHIAQDQKRSRDEIRSVLR